MDVHDALGPDEQFIQGDKACVYGALIAGCSFFAGYPITPATEISEEMSRLLPKIGGVFMQMEDEIASMGAIIGASWTGRKTMTATSGPGFSLMQENIGYAVMTETPCVIVDVQRGGPSTGQPTKPSQGDVMQARYGSHGDYEIIVLCPSTVQEALELSIRAFNLSEKYRVPVIMLMEESLGHMREKIRIPHDILIVNRDTVDISYSHYKPFRTGYMHATKIPEFAPFGSGYKTFITGLTHDEDGFPSPNDVKVHAELIERLSEKITENIDDIFYADTKYLEYADTVVISYGIAARPSLSAVNRAQRTDRNVAFVNLNTLWPFNYEFIADLSKQVERIIVVEMNMGMIYHKIREAAEGRCDVKLLRVVGGGVPTPKEILELIK
ncbi:MAG TPA: 2-oxoacid:acceptor oxidoreductase subunit alpha [Candidatus Methanofastidiosa archaeon]|nr:2-oxoacid:acceptor oxidoreductase subunit alpha [Candidatus Methanofastidiosa archaeon]HPR42033.1 2-oxoacid:acceptor oxidoreductase subunit alpha [Candidatus Methanofastidiosa archaeon]